MTNFVIDLILAPHRSEADTFAKTVLRREPKEFCIICNGQTDPHALKGVSIGVVWELDGFRHTEELKRLLTAFQNLGRVGSWFKETDYQRIFHSKKQIFVQTPVK